MRKCAEKGCSGLTLREPRMVGSTLQENMLHLLCFKGFQMGVPLMSIDWNFAIYPASFRAWNLCWGSALTKWSQSTFQQTHSITTCLGGSRMDWFDSLNCCVEQNQYSRLSLRKLQPAKYWYALPVVYCFTYLLVILISYYSTECNLVNSTCYWGLG